MNLDPAAPLPPHLSSEPDRLLPIDEVARILRLSPRTVFRLVKRGELIPPLRIGRSIRWRLTDIQIWLATAYPQPLPQPPKP
jgi:excisionase family DNA binding protein